MSSSRKKNYPREKALVTLALIGDIIIIALSDLAAFALRFETDIAAPPPANFIGYLAIANIILPLRLICFYIAGLYYNLKSKTTFDLAVNALKASMVSFLCVIATAFFYRAFAYPRSVIVLSSILTFCLIIFWRVFMRALLSIIFGRSFLSSRIAIVGVDKDAQQFALHITKSGAIHYELVGFIAGGNFLTPPPPAGATLLGSLDDLSAIVDTHAIDEVIIATDDIDRDRLIRVLADLPLSGVHCKVMPQIYEAVIGNVMASSIDDRSTILLAPYEEQFYWYRGFKRVFDLVIAALALVVTTPLLPLVAIAVKITSPGPALFKQKRVGLYGKNFVLFKFRTMMADAEKDGPVWAGKNDPRITPIGRFLRKTRLDELPQLYNVLRNDMSLVGPRPERAYFVNKLKQEIPFYLERLAVKPGITGWAQITLPYADSVESSRTKFIHDMYYIKNMSFPLDVLILLRTILIIIQEKGAQ